MISTQDEEEDEYIGHSVEEKMQRLATSALSRQTMSSMCCDNHCHLKEPPSHHHKIDINAQISNLNTTSDYNNKCNWKYTQVDRLNELNNIFQSSSDLKNKADILSNIWNNSINHDAHHCQLHQTTSKGIKCTVSKNVSDLEKEAQAYKLTQTRENYESLYDKLTSFKIIFDTGASRHVFPTTDAFYHYQEYNTEDRYVSFGEGSKKKIRGIGHTCLLKNVYYVPEIAVAVISIPQLDLAGYKANFGNGCVELYNSEDFNDRLTGTLKNGLYHLDDLWVRVMADITCHNYRHEINKNARNHLRTGDMRRINEWMLRSRKRDVDDLEEEILSENSETVELQELYLSTGKINLNDEINISRSKKKRYRKGKIRLDSSNDNLLMKIHKNYGHLSEEKIKLAYKKGLIIDNQVKYDDIKDLKLPLCPDCMRGRMKAFPSGDTTDHPWNIFQKIAMDYKGPFKTRSYNGYTGFYLFSDYKSDYVWAYPVKSKSEGGLALRKFYDRFIRRSGRNNAMIITLQSDVDSVIRSRITSEYCDRNRIKLQMSPSYKHSHNGQIERDMQSVLDKARTLLASYEVPIQWWWHAIQHAIWCINRSPTSKPDSVTPYEMVTGKKPNCNEMLPFFCPGLYHVTKEERQLRPLRQWESKAIPCRFLGHDEDSVGYIIYDILSRKVVEHRTDIVWDPTLIEQELKSFPQNETDDSEEEEKFPEREMEIASDEEDETKSVESSKSESSKASNEEDDEEELKYWYYVNNVKSLGGGKNSQKEEFIGSLEILSDYDIDYNFTGSFLNKVTEILEDDVERVWLDIGPTIEHNLDDFINSVVLTNNSDLIGKLPEPPKNEIEALSPDNPDRDRWIKAIDEELGVLAKYKVFEEADQVGHAMKTKFVFTITYRSDYTIKYKARLVACGYSQIKGIDYNETYSPTIGLESIFICLFLAAWANLYTIIFDVKSAFLEGRADCIQYCRLPLCASNGNVPQRVKIVGNLYGEKQAPKVWNDHLNDNILMKMNFIRCPWDACLYICWKDDGVIILSVHVDDGYILATSEELIEWFTKTLLDYVKGATIYYPEEGVTQKYIGIEIERVFGIYNGDIVSYSLLTQKEKISNLNHFPNYKPRRKIDVPMPENVNLRDAIPNETNPSLLPVTGSLRFICDRTRPDLLVATGEISTGAIPSDLHYKVAERTEYFLKQTIERCLQLGGRGKMIHFAFCDAAYITTGKAKSRLGHCQFLGMDSGAIRSFSHNDKTVSHSSMEAEIKSLDLLIIAIILTRNILKFLGYELKVPTIIFMDNKSAIELCKTLKQNHKARNINMRIQFIRECINARIVELVFIRSENNVADILTKPLGRNLFDKHSYNLLNGFHGNIDHLFKDSLTHVEVNNSIEIMTTIPHTI